MNYGYPVVVDYSKLYNYYPQPSAPPANYHIQPSAPPANYYPQPSAPQANYNNII